MIVVRVVAGFSPTKSHKAAAHESHHGMCAWLRCGRVVVSSVALAQCLASRAQTRSGIRSDRPLLPKARGIGADVPA